MMNGSEINIWQKVDYGLARQEKGDSEEKTPAETIAERSRQWRRWRISLDVVGTIFWVYVTLKVFFFDVDRELVESLIPGHDWIIDFRFLAFLIIAAIAVLALGPRKALLCGAYIFFFPLIVLIWKLPKLLYKSKSWISLFAAIHVVASVLANFRYAVIATALGVLSAVLILWTNSHALLAFAMAVIASLLLLALGRTLLFSAQPASFIDIQEKALARIRKSNGLPQIAAISDELRDNQVQRFNEQQQMQFLMNLQSAVLMQRLPLFWAYQLEQYRRSPVPVLFTGLAYAWLVLQTVIGLALLNYGLYKIDPSAFQFEDAPSILVFGRYAVSSLSGSEIGAVQPEGAFANVLFLGATALGIIFLIGFVVGLFLSFRQKSQDAALREMIHGFKEQSRELDRQLQREYDVVSAEEALRRLEELKAGLLGIITFFSSRIPDDFEDSRANDGDRPS
jgi:hypothetical protein